MLEVRNVTKKFSGVTALKNVSCAFENGEIHALLGENGAGKSTLMKIVCGVFPATEGEIYIEGERVEIKDYNSALKHGISLVSQEIQVIPFSSIAENIMLDKLDNFKRAGRIDWKKLNAEAQKYMDLLSLKLPPTMPVMNLSPAHKQMVQIAKALSSNAKYLLLDEPTSSLTNVEVELLMDRLRELKKQGLCIIFISHKLEEVLELCDRFTVLRDGEVIGTRSCDAATKEDIVEMMIGRKGSNRYLGQLEVDRSEPSLEVRGLCQGSRFKDISFKAYPGEILGFYGLVGSGRTELARAIIGDTKIDRGEIRIHGQVVKIGSVADAVNKYNVGYVSENRKEDGLITEFDVLNNSGIVIWESLRKGMGPINTRQEKARVSDMVNKLEVKTPSLYQKVRNLSGGNQQKLSIGKWILGDNDILFVDEPTVGVDVGAKEYIHELIWNMAEKEKKTIILISSDMPEIIKLARRMLIFRDFQIVAELDDLNVPAPGRPQEEIAAEIGQYFV